MNLEASQKLDNENFFQNRDYRQADKVLETVNNFMSEEDYITHESNKLSLVLNKQLEQISKKLNQTLEKYENRQLEPVNLFQEQLITYEPVYTEHTQIEQVSEAFLDQNLFDQAPTPAHSSLFEENFLSDINNLLNDDFIDLTEPFVANDLINQNYLTNFTDLELNLFEQGNTELTPLKTVDQSELACKIAEDTLENVDLFDLSQEHIISEWQSESGQSKITISKLGKQKNPANSTAISSSQNKTAKIADLSVIDKKEDVLALIKSTASIKKNLSNTSLPALINNNKDTTLPSTKPKTLLPWEIKTKEIKSNISKKFVNFKIQNLIFLKRLKNL